MKYSLHPHTLFWGILKRASSIDTFVDAGSCDGSESFLVESRFPTMRCVAIEPHPQNAIEIRQTIEQRKSRVVLEEVALGNSNGETTFYVVNLDRAPDHNRGSSSLRVPVDISVDDREKLHPHRVKLRRLDSLESLHEGRRIALRVDTESTGFEVLEGISAIAEHVCLVQVEVECRPFRVGQRLAGEVFKLLEGYGFELAGTSLDPSLSRPPIGDAVFVRPGLLPQASLRMLQFRAALVWRFRAQSVLRALLPKWAYEGARRVYYNAVMR